MRDRWFLSAAGAVMVGALVGGQAGWATDVRAQAAAPVVVPIVAERFSFWPTGVEIPPGTSVEFRLSSLDTMHGFRILGTDIDVRIPKRGRGERTVVFKAPAEGRFTFECSKLCGAGHSFMRGTITVREPSQER